MNIFDVSGLVVIVTGSSGGNGSAISDTLQKLGCIVINADLPDCDITNNNDIDSLLLKARNYNGQINGLINCAGITIGNNLFDYKDGDWNKTYEVNLKAPYQLTKKVAVYMKNTGGSIINITSINSELGFPDNPAYIATKGGLKQLTKSFARDLGQFNIRVNNIGPGYIKTNMTKKGWANNRKEIENRTILGRWGQPEDLVGAVVFLLSNASSYITGQDIYIDGGYLAKGL
jgi:NAD(P)-dependent dehydrogenase (short-subunit alcohol dehydrogenase family)